MRRSATALACVLSALSLVAAPAPAAPTEPLFVVTGRGWGHGVGMSQWGARGQALRGAGYRRILAHYYRGARLGGAPMARVRVLLAEERVRVRVGSKRAFVLVDGRGRRFRLPAGAVVVGPGLAVRVAGRKQRLTGPLRFSPGGRALRLDLRPYRGDLVLHRRGGRLAVVNDVGLERYLRGVVPWEMPHDWPLEALRAQAVVARSYAIATRATGRFYDLLPDTRDQVYGGIGAEKPESTRAVDSTAGKVLWWGGRVATTYYHSTSGGRTASVWEVWPGSARVPYLSSVPDPHDAASPHHRWGPFAYTPRQLGRALKLRAPRDAVVERNGSGRAVRVAFGRRRLTGDELRRALGLRSSWFELGVLALERPAEPAVWGRPLVLEGIARDVRGAVVERRDEGRWRTVARARAGRDGRFRARVRALASEFRIAGGGVAASPLRVRLAPDVAVRRAATGLAGVVRPALPRAVVRIQRLAGPVWRTVQTVRADAEGAFATDDELPPGRYRVRVDPTRGFAAGASDPFAR